MNVHRRIRLFLLLLSIGAVAGGAWGSMVLPQNLERLESEAQLLFVGVCTSRTATIGPRGIPVNVFTFEVTEAVKGRLKKGSRVEFRQFGSDVPHANGLTLRVAGLPNYRVGQEVLLFLNRPSRIGLTAPVGLSQGVFPVVRGAKGKREIVLDPVRRKFLLSGMDIAKYAASSRFTASEQRLLSDLPKRVDVATFCSLLRKMGQERESQKQTGKNGQLATAN